MQGTSLILEMKINTYIPFETWAAVTENYTLANQNNF